MTIPNFTVLEESCGMQSIGIPEKTASYLSQGKKNVGHQVERHSKAPSIPSHGDGPRQVSQTTTKSTF